jgi:hypothetical protein
MGAVRQIAQFAFLEIRWTATREACRDIAENQRLPPRSPRALAQRVAVDAKEARVMGSKSELLRTLVAASSAKTAGFGVPAWYRNGAPRSMKMGTRSNRQSCDCPRFFTTPDG